jgi:hypothetical protein
LDGRETDFQMTLGIKVKILRFEISMGHALAMQVREAADDLFETTFDLGLGHAASFDRGVEISAWAKLHYFAPTQMFVLDEVHGFDDVYVVQGRGYTKLGSEFLHVFLFRLVLSPFAELLDGVKLLFASVPLMGETDDGGSTLADSDFLANAIFRETGHTVTGSGLALAIRGTLPATPI